MNHPAVKYENDGITLFVENIKCDGCGKRISSKLTEDGLANIEVDPGAGTVHFANTDDVHLNRSIQTLHGLGYPLLATESGVAAALLRAKSFLSCAIGRTSK